MNNRIDHSCVLLTWVYFMCVCVCVCMSVCVCVCVNSLVGDDLKYQVIQQSELFCYLQGRVALKRL